MGGVDLSVRYGNRFFRFDLRVECMASESNVRDRREGRNGCVTGDYLVGCIIILGHVAR